MVVNIKITNKDILTEVKLSGKLPEIISQIIDRQIIATAVSQEKIKIGNLELQEAADRFRLLNRLKTARSTIEWLQKNSLSVENLEQIAEHMVNTSKLAENLFSRDSIEKYFVEHHLDYTEVVMYEIILDSQDLAMEIFDAIQGDRITFQQAASQYITDPELRRRGGYSGIRRCKQMSPEVSAVVFAQRNPRLLKPLTTSQGTHLIYVEQIIDPQLEECFGEIVDNLFDRWLQAYKSDINILKVAI